MHHETLMYEIGCIQVDGLDSVNAIFAHLFQFMPLKGQCIFLMNTLNKYLNPSVKWTVVDFVAFKLH